MLRIKSHNNYTTPDLTRDISLQLLPKFLTSLIVSRYIFTQVIVSVCACNYNTFYAKYQEYFLNNSQELFWQNQITSIYTADNSHFDEMLSQTAWRKILLDIDMSEIKSYLECGSNIGRNTKVLKKILPKSNAKNLVCNIKC